MINLKKLKGTRVEEGLTQIQLSNKLDMPVSTYRKKESGKSPFTLEEATKISKILNKKIDEIFLQTK